MSNSISIFCDESCHLEHDGQKVMTIGGVWCDNSVKYDAYSRIRSIKEKHGFHGYIEVKWTKIAKSNVDLYLDLIDYFFDNSELNFRCIVIPNKDELNHEKYGQTHNEWYYKMYFEMLKTVIDDRLNYEIYLDIKDTIGGTKVNQLREVLSNNAYDFDRKTIKRIQLVRSHEIELLQLADILIGAVMAENRGETISGYKRAVIERIKDRSGISLVKSTLPSERKTNIFIWKPDWNK